MWDFYAKIFKAMETESEIEFFRLTGTEWFNPAQKATMKRNNVSRGARHIKINKFYLHDRFVRCVELRNLKPWKRLGILRKFIAFRKKIMWSETETFSGRPRPRLSLCEPTVCERFFKVRVARCICFVWKLWFKIFRSNLVPRVFTFEPWERGWK